MSCTVSFPDDSEESISENNLFAENVFVDESGQVKSTFTWKVNDTRNHYGMPQSNHQQSPNFKTVNSDITWNLCLQNVQPGFYLLYLRSSKKEDVSKSFKYFVNGEPLMAFRSCSSKNISVISREKLFGPHGFLQGTISVKFQRLVECAEHGNQCALLMQDFDRLLSDAKFSDFVIETGDGIRIPVHRNVLSARSPVFSAMLDSDMAEKDRRCLKIDDFSTQTVKDMIKYLYTGRIPELCFETASELLKVADKYDLKSLKNICRENLRLNLTVENAIQILQIADMYREKSLKTNVLEFISKNRAAFTNRQVFDTHLKQNPSLLIDVIECLTHCEK